MLEHELKPESRQTAPQNGRKWVKLAGFMSLLISPEPFTQDIRPPTIAREPLIQFDQKVTAFSQENSQSVSGAVFYLFCIDTESGQARVLPQEGGKILTLQNAIHLIPDGVTAVECLPGAQVP